MDISTIRNGSRPTVTVSSPRQADPTLARVGDRPRRGVRRHRVLAAAHAEVAGGPVVDLQGLAPADFPARSATRSQRYRSRCLSSVSPPSLALMAWGSTMSSCSPVRGGAQRRRPGSRSTRTTVYRVPSPPMPAGITRVTQQRGRLQIRPFKRAAAVASSSPGRGRPRRRGRRPRHAGVPAARAGGVDARIGSTARSGAGGASAERRQAMPASAHTASATHAAPRSPRVYAERYHVDALV